MQPAEVAKLGLALWGTHPMISALYFVLAAIS